MLKRYFLILFILNTISLFAVKIEPTILYQPAKYSRTVDQYDFDTDDDRTEAPWIVWSDRKKTTTKYSAKTTGAVKDTLNFMDQFYVINETDEFINIAQKDPDKGEIDELLIGNWKNFGWVHKSKMLLWHRPLHKSKTNLVLKKIIIMNSISSIKNSVKNQNFDYSNFMNGPSVNNDVLFLSKMFDFYNLYKVEIIDDEKWYFVGNSDFIEYDETIADRNAGVGWVSEKKAVLWDTRLAIEQNWDLEAIQEFITHDKKATVWKEGNKGLKEIIYSIEKKDYSDVLHYNNFSLDYIRPDGTFTRYPILEQKNTAIVLKNDKEIRIATIGVIGDITGTTDGKTSEKKTIRTSLEMARIKREMEKILRIKKQINILFVIDATNSMQPYYSAVKKAINSVISDYGISENDLDFAVAIYRDLKEGKERAFQISDFTTNRSETIAFLDSVLCNPHPKNQTIAEDMLYGLDRALEEASPKGMGKRSNFIVLIGDAGNYTLQQDKNFKQKINSIAENLTAYNYRFLAIQVANKNHKAFDDFYLQLNQLGNLYGEFLNKQVIFDNTKYQMNNNVDSLIYSYPDDCFQYFTINRIQKDKIVLPNELQTEISNYIRNAKQEVDQKIKIAYSLIQNQTIKNGFNIAVVDDIFKSFDLDPDDISFIKSKKEQLFLKGIVVLKEEDLVHPFFKKVVLLSFEELNSLNEKYRKLTKWRSRKKLQELYVGYLQELGASIDNYSNFSLAEILETIVGIPINEESILKTIKFSEIKTLSNSKLTEISKSLNKKYLELNNIQKNLGKYTINGKSFDCHFTTYSLDHIYFWIDTDFLP